MTVCIRGGENAGCARCIGALGDDSGCLALAITEGPGIAKCAGWNQSSP